jgi:hypothetical protein
MTIKYGTTPPDKIVRRAYEEVRHSGFETARTGATCFSLSRVLGHCGSYLFVLHKPCLFQSGKLLLGFGHEWQLGVSALPEREEILVINPGALAVIGCRLRPAHRQMG